MGIPFLTKKLRCIVPSVAINVSSEFHGSREQDVPGLLGTLGRLPGNECSVDLKVEQHFLGRETEVGILGRP